MIRKPNILQASKLFTDAKYEIPIYQRNYAWEEKQIHQLIDDIYTSNDTYFLGNLIVNQKDTNVFEVIDGQQRLTTLFLLVRYLKMNVLKGSLYFEARKKSNRTILIIGTEEEDQVLDELQSEEINRGYKIIKEYFRIENIDEDSFKQKLSMTQLIRIQVPQKIDLNHYFEVMNTRGEQLEFHEIAKAKLLSKLTTNRDKKVGSLIWDACSNMDTYIQMNFDSETRKILFSSNWSELRKDITDFDNVSKRLFIKESDNKISQTKTLLAILSDNKQTANDQNNKSEDVENDRFESIISFPNFILQVNEAISNSETEDESLDDRRFLDILSKNWENENNAKAFLFNLLKCRVLYDKYILKREFARNYKETGNWSLQRLEAYKDGSYWKPKYVATYGGDDNYNKQLRTLQSCLRITYTSPKTMHWISLVLKSLLKDNESDILKILERYCEKKVIESNYKEASGFKFERIVFTYLDYILYRDGYSYQGKQIISPQRDDWQFQFRNSIEHFYPQNPVDSDPSAYWDSRDLNKFGNLALITVSGNSKFSNLPPEGKVSSYRKIVDQSLKLRVMKQMMELNAGKWNQEISESHQEEMFRMLDREEVAGDVST